MAIPYGRGTPVQMFIALGCGRTRVCERNTFHADRAAVYANISERKHGLSAEQFPASSHVGSSNKLKDRKDTHRPWGGPMQDQPCCRTLRAHIPYLGRTTQLGRKCLNDFENLFTENGSGPGQKLALTGLFVPSSLNSGRSCLSASKWRANTFEVLSCFTRTPGLAVILTFLCAKSLERACVPQGYLTYKKTPTP